MVCDINGNGNYPSDAGIRVKGKRQLQIEPPAGATVKVQVLGPDGSTFRDLPDGQFTSQTVKVMDFDVPSTVRLNVSGYVSTFKASF